MVEDSVIHIRIHDVAAALILETSGEEVTRNSGSTKRNSGSTAPGGIQGPLPQEELRVHQEELRVHQEELRVHCHRRNSGSDSRSEDFILVPNSSQGTVGWDMKCEPALISEENKAPVVDLLVLVFSVCRSRTRSRHEEAEQVVVAGTQYRSQRPKGLDLNPGDRIQVLFKEDEDWWFGRLSNEQEGQGVIQSHAPVGQEGVSAGRCDTCRRPLWLHQRSQYSEAAQKKKRPSGTGGGVGSQLPRPPPPGPGQVQEKELPPPPPPPPAPPPPADPGSFNTAFLPDDAGH
ncbi:unnamed protein product [Pleuronectes platessa]|uniref:SH3 domain-containing protein n=1 Tax=Pleuronectes platessa TaxID=8262 RepID=A0A9N7Z7D5_PLEPL|nr:unnamed protein product [Pleuronectes platessa]